MYLQSSAPLESRRYARELQVQREIAEEAETSRITHLHSFLEAELQRLAIQTEETKAGILARVDQLDRDLRLAMEQSGNTLAAYIGEIDDKVDRAIGAKIPDASE